MMDPFDRALALVKERRPELVDEFRKLQTTPFGSEAVRLMDRLFPLREGSWGPRNIRDLAVDIRDQMDGKL